MAYKRYIRKNGKLYGPYLYKSVRDKHGRVRNIYVGPAKTDTRQARSFTLQPFQKGILAVVAVLCALSAAAFLLSPTGLVVQEKTKTHVVSIDKMFNETGEIGIELDDAPESLAITGEIKGNGRVKIYAVSGDDVMVLYERSPESTEPSITGMAVGGNDSASETPPAVSGEDLLAEDGAVAEAPADAREAPAAGQSGEDVNDADAPLPSGDETSSQAGELPGEDVTGTTPPEELDALNESSPESGDTAVSDVTNETVPDEEAVANETTEANASSTPAVENATETTPAETNESLNGSSSGVPGTSGNAANDTTSDVHEPSNGTLPAASNATNETAGDAEPLINETNPDTANTTNETGEGSGETVNGTVPVSPPSSADTLELVDYCRDTCTVFGLNNSIRLVVEVEPGTTVFIEGITYAYTVELDNATMQQPGMEIAIESPSNTSYGKGPIEFAVETSTESDWCSFILDEDEPVLMAKDSESRFEHAVEDIDSGDHHVTFFCQDTLGNLTTSETIHFSLVLPRVLLSIKEPSGDIKANKGEPFPVTIEISCIDADCGDVQLALDPEKEGGKS